MGRPPARRVDATRALLAAAALALALAALPAAQAIPPGALSLEATGHAAIGGEIEQVRLELAFSPGADASFTRGGGLLLVGTSSLDRLDIDGAFTRDSRDLRLSGTAAGHGEPVAVSLDGRLAEARGDLSVYLLTGTLERGGMSGRAAFAALLAPIHSERDPAVKVSVPAEPEGDASRTLRASGYAAVGEFIEDVTLNLSFTEDADGSFSSSEGALGIGGYALGTLDVEGEFTREGRFVSVSGTASGRGEPVALRLLGRIAEGHGGETAYLFTGTLERGSSGKAVLAARVSGPEAGDPPPRLDEINVRLLAAPRQPGAPPGHFDEPILHVRPGQNVTIANTDAEAHRLVSGTVNAWFYERTGAGPRTCSPDGEPDDANAPEASRGVSREQAELDRCDFTRDARVGVTVGAGESTTIHIAEAGIYRILDPAAPWIQLLAVSVDTPVRCPPHCH